VEQHGRGEARRVARRGGGGQQRPLAAERSGGASERAAQAGALRRGRQAAAATPARRPLSCMFLYDAVTGVTPTPTRHSKPSFFVPFAMKASPLFSTRGAVLRRAAELRC